jgi:NSS family neurotransmitter:Na+ symporter
MALMEPWVSWLMERFGLRRAVATCVATGSCWIVGQGSVLSFGMAADWRPLAGIPRFATLNLFGIVDFLSSNLLMPLSTLFVSVFLGWRIGALAPDTEYSGLSGSQRRLLLFALRYLCPIGIIVILAIGLTG